MSNELVPKQYQKIVNSCPVCNSNRLYYYYDTVVSNIDVICPACKRFLIVINEDQNSKNIHLHIYESQSIVNGIIHAHESEFKDW